MTVRSYSSPPAFKQALEQRLKAASKDGVDFARRRQLLVFDRFLARASTVLGKSVLLKGGLVLELRLERARTTKDVDLRVTGSPANLLASLQEAGRQDLGDFMSFEVVPDAEHPTIENDGMPYEGQRFRAECRLAGKLYGQRFGVDIGFGDPILGEPDIVTADDLLDFAGIAPPVLQIYPIETHIAEKLHAYTMPRARTNTPSQGSSGHRLACRNPGTGGRTPARSLRANLYASSDTRAAAGHARSSDKLVSSLPADGSRE